MNARSVRTCCTLPVAAQPFRLMEFARALPQPDQTAAHDRRPSASSSPVANANGLYAQVSDLVARETACCSFFEFTINQHAQDATDLDHLVLRVAVPASHADVLEALTDPALAAMRSGDNGDVD